MADECQKGCTCKLESYFLSVCECIELYTQDQKSYQHFECLKFVSLCTVYCISHLPAYLYNVYPILPHGEILLLKYQVHMCCSTREDYGQLNVSCRPIVLKHDTDELFRDCCDTESCHPVVLTFQSDTQCTSNASCLIFEDIMSQTAKARSTIHSSDYLVMRAIF